MHHPVAVREAPDPSWLTIPERGLYTGVLICGAIGSGKTSACMRPFARQLLGWHAGDRRRRAAGLVLEVKGIKKRIAEVEARVKRPGTIRVRFGDLGPHDDELEAAAWTPAGDGIVLA